MRKFMILKSIIVLLISFFLTYLLVPLNIKFSKKLKLVDKPSERGINNRNIPLAGGLSFAFPVILLQIVYYFLFPEFGLEVLKLAIGGLAILILGFLDDKKKYTANYKLLFQIIIVVIMFIIGFKIELLTNPFGEAIHSGIFSFPLTVIWFLIVINAFNLIDGIDGLASGIALIVSIVLMAVSLVCSNNMIVFLCLILIGSNLAFLKYNFYPAKIFMGDTGSLFIGFNIATISVIGTTQFKGITTMTLLIPIIALIIPLSDTFLAIFRRIKKKKNIFMADKEHIHHKMLKMGFSQKTIALISYFITFLFGLIAFGFSFATKEILLVILILLFIPLSIFFFYLMRK